MRALKPGIIFLFLLSSVFYSQNAFAKKAKWRFNISGQVVKYSVVEFKNVALDSCTISLYKDSILVSQKFNPDTNGFSFSLEPDANYVIACGKDGYITNRIAIDTKDVPDGKTSNSFAKMDLQIILYKTYPEYDYSFLQKPLVRICYSYAIDDFDYDTDYELSMAANYRKMEGLSAIAMKHEMYVDEIERGDKYFAQEKWEDAKSAYLGASANLPREQYPVDQVKICDEKIAVIKAAEEAKDKKYADLLAQADAKFEKKDYTGAKTLYEQASLLHPELFYPKTRMQQCDTAPADDKKYSDLIAAADKLFSSANYDAAKDKYQQAAMIKPGEKYPVDQIKKCDEAPGIINNYNKTLAQAEAQFKTKDYANAKKSYQQASALKPDQQYPKDQIKKCDDALALSGGDKKQYEDLIAKADVAFKVKDYVNAKQAYQEASNLKPDEQYPKDQIKICENNMFRKSANSIDKSYQDTLAAADKLFNTIKDYEAAKAKYQQASALKPLEQYPKDQIKKCDDFLKAAAQGNEGDYKDAISIADNLFSAKDYQEAKTYYEKASTLKPSEQYPKDRIKACDDALTAAKPK
jgi:hypothetical protein